MEDSRSLLLDISEALWVTSSSPRGCTMAYTAVFHCHVINCHLRTLKYHHLSPDLTLGATPAHCHGSSFKRLAFFVQEIPPSPPSARLGAASQALNEPELLSSMLITTPLTPGAPLRANYHPPLITQGSSPAPPAAPPAAAGHRNPPPGGLEETSRSRRRGLSLALGAAPTARYRRWRSGGGQSPTPGACAVPLGTAGHGGAMGKQR